MIKSCSVFTYNKPSWLYRIKTLSQLNTFAKQFFPSILVFALMVFTLYWQKITINQWVEKLDWLPFAALAGAALFAIQFGRSRIVFCVLALLSLLIIPLLGQSLLPNYLIGLTCCLCWLLFRPDKGLLPVNLFYSVLELLLVMTASILLLPALSTSLESPLSLFYPLLMAMGPWVSEAFTPFEFTLFFLLSLVSLVRLILSVTNSNIAIFLTFSIVVIIFADTNGYIITTSATCIAGFYIVAIMIDSFNMAYRDELTGIPSRRALNQYVQTLGRKYVVVMSDIDHFKKFNDTYGHDVGDQVLRLVASKLNKVTGGGRAFRYGGEEFTLIFPRKSYKEVVAHVEVLREIIADYPIVLRGQDRPEHPPKKRAKGADKPKNKVVHVTCSFGVSERSPAFPDFEAIVKQADIALYAAKKAGRNCVQTADS